MPNVLITGAGRRAGIAAACAMRLAHAGWNVGLSCWRPYGRETGPARADREPLDLVEELRDLGIRAELAEVRIEFPAEDADRILATHRGNSVSYSYRLFWRVY